MPAPKAVTPYVRAPIEVAAAGIAGLAIGSFLTVVAHRVPAGASIVAPGSHCPGCEAPIRPVDNVPVLSYALRRGRCRSCGVRIPLRYPLTELATGALFAALAARVPGGWSLAAYCVLGAALVVLCVIDLELLRLPTPILLAAAALGAPLLLAASAASGTWSACTHAAIAAGVCGGALLLVWLLVPRGIGLGDVRLATLCGGFLGWLGYRVTAVGFMAAFLSAGIVALVLLGVGRAGRRTRLPFGPFLGLGAMVAVLWGTDLARLWLG